MTTLYVNAFKDHVNVGFFHGAVLEDPAGLLEGTGKRMRHVKLRPGREPDVAALGDLIVVYPGERRYSIAEGMEAIPLTDLMRAGQSDDVSFKKRHR